MEHTITHRLAQRSACAWRADETKRRLWPGLHGYWAALLATALTACGGGTEGTSSNGYYGVTGTHNGSVYTVCIDNTEMIDPSSSQGAAVTAKLVSYYGLTGDIRSQAGTGQGCREKFPLANTIISVDFYNSAISGGSGSGSGSGSLTYMKWAGSENEAGIRDFGGNVFGAQASDGQVYHWPGGGVENKLNGLTVTSADLYAQGRGKIGYVGLADSTAGGKIAAFYCNDGRGMVINVATNGWQDTCSSSGTGSGSGTPSPTLYGAISYGSNSSGQRAFGITSNYGDQSSADADANSVCTERSSGAVTCGVVLNIVGRGTCGVLAWNDMGWGAVTRTNLQEARNAAMSGCTQQTGATCSLAAEACNQP